jgi:hypothetical protein
MADAAEHACDANGVLSFLKVVVERVPLRHRRLGEGPLFFFGVLDHLARHAAVTVFEGGFTESPLRPCPV